jgi:multidrug efflux pump subunit AcrA (membrane-fusion protein)
MGSTLTAGSSADTSWCYGATAAATAGSGEWQPRPMPWPTVTPWSSMKMEIPVLAEGSGTLARLAVAEGDVVQEGDLIAVIQ